MVENKGNNSQYTNDTFATVLFLLCSPSQRPTFTTLDKRNVKKNLAYHRHTWAQLCTMRAGMKMRASSRFFGSNNKCCKKDRHRNTFPASCPSPKLEVNE